MQYTGVKEPKWANAAHTIIDCLACFPSINSDFIAFSAIGSGDYDYTHEIFARCVAGDFGPIAEYAPPPPLGNDVLAEMARTQRDQLLSECDWTQLTDVPPLNKDLWQAYRQKLRDLPSQSGFPLTIVWPDKP